jgi:hypothetical protein
LVSESINGEKIEDKVMPITASFTLLASKNYWHNGFTCAYMANRATPVRCRK